MVCWTLVCCIALHWVLQISILVSGFSKVHLDIRNLESFLSGILSGSTMTPGCQTFLSWDLFMLDWSVKSRRNLTLDFCKCAQTSLPSGVDDNRRNFTHCIICSHRWCQCIIKPTVYLDTVWWRPGCLSVWVAQMTVFSSAILWAVVFLLFSLLSVSYPPYRERAMWLN